MVISAEKSFPLHKFVLAARSPYFRRKLTQAPETTSYKLPSSIPPQAFDLAIRYVYFGETLSDVSGGPGTGFTDEEILAGIDKLGKQLEVGIGSLWDLLLAGGENKRIARQRRVDEIENGRDQLEAWFLDNVMKHKIEIATSKADSVKWDRENGIFADVLLRADEPSNVENDPTPSKSGVSTPQKNASIPIGPLSRSSLANALSNPSTIPEPRSTLFPANRAMLLRSEYFLTMFSSSFLEAQSSPHLRIIPVSCSPAVLSTILTYLYTEKSDIPLELAVDVLFAADELFIEKLKTKAAVVIATLGNGVMNQKDKELKDASSTVAGDRTSPSEHGVSASDPIDPYLVLRAAWLTRVPRLEQFAARYFAYRLERYLDEEEFTEVIKESAARIEQRQEIDSIELVDDIRFYLSERFRLRFEDVGWEEMEEEEDMKAQRAQEQNVAGGKEEVKGELDDLASSMEETPSAIALKAKSIDNNNQDRDQAVLAANVAAEGEIRTLDGDVAGDEFAADAQNYEILLARIDGLLEGLKLDA